MSISVRVIKAVSEHYPAIIPHLKGRARWVVTRGEFKTYDYFLRELERMITNVYRDQLGGEFIDIMASLIYGQLEQAYRQAWQDEEGEGDLPDYLADSFESMYLNQFDFVDQFYRDIVDARIDETPIDPLLTRAHLWAHRYIEAYNEAVRLITLEGGGNMVWELGATEDHCSTCSALNGVVARASEWDALGVHPQGAPNDLIECGGWQCDCSLTPTDRRRSPKAYESIMNIVQKG
jgi:hypothetical protein